MGDEIRSEGWITGLPSEDKMFDLEDERPEVLAALKEQLGYDGHIWFRVRALTAVEKEARQAESVEFNTTGGDPADRFIVRGEALLRFDIQHMVVDGRFPVFRNERYVEQPWDKSEAGATRNYKHVQEMGEEILQWLLRKLAEVRGDEIEETVETVKNSLEAQAKQ